MLTTVPTLTSINEDVSNSADVKLAELRPYNRQLLSEEHYNRIHSESNENLTIPSFLSPNHLKQFFRSSHLHASHPARSSLWYNLLRQDQTRHQYRFQQAVERYPEDIRNMFGRRNDISVRLPPCVDANHLPYYHLNRTGQHAVIRILSVFAYYHPDITWAPLLAPITALFLHYMTEIDAYESLLILTSNDYKIITQTEIQYQSLTFAFRALLRRHCRSTFDILSKQTQQNTIFDDWLWLIFEHLPFSYLVPIIDCLLVEDMKILIRTSMTLYHFFVKYGLSTQLLYPRVRRRTSIFRRSKLARQSARFHRQTTTGVPLSSNTTTATTKTTLAITEALISYIQHFDIPIDKFFKHAFGIHHLQRKEIFRVIENKVRRHLEKIRRVLHVEFRSNFQVEEDKIKLERRRVLPQLRRSSSTNDQLAPINPLNHTKSFLNRPILHQNSMPVIMIREFDTTTASHSDFAYLWSFIPSRLTDFQPERIYSSNIHGRRLRTLYDHVEYHEYCLIIIRNEHQQIFGAFCAGQLANRSKNRSWFGTGESFLFTLKPERQVFKWVGYQSSTRGATKAHEDYFIYADDERLQMGGSLEPLNIGLMIKQDLNEGSTRVCDTYASQPLSTSEDFQIMEIEVFGFTR